MATRYLTVVFEINNEKEFKSMKDSLRQRMVYEDTLGWRVSAMSLGDDIAKCELVEDAINKITDIYELQEICGNIFSSLLPSLEGKTIFDFT